MMVIREVIWQKSSTLWLVARSLGRIRSSSSNFPEARYKSSLGWIKMGTVRGKPGFEAKSVLSFPCWDHLASLDEGGSSFTPRNHLSL